MDNLTIVTGLFRSGSSMMMQILEAGGYKPIVHYFNRDEHNENGYYEIEEDQAGRVHGKICAGEYPSNSCIKVLTPFLEKNKIIDLADNVIFISRNVSEVRESFNLKFGYRPYKRKLLYMQRDTKIFLQKQMVKTYFVDYNEIMSDPKEGLINLKKEIFQNKEENFLEACSIPEKRLYKTHAILSKTK